MMLRGATSVAAVAAIGNLLQGWDGGAIAGKGQLIFLCSSKSCFVILSYQ